VLARRSRKTDSKRGGRVALTRETILTAFEQLGLRHTRPRRLLAERLAALGASATDFSTDDLWHDLKARDPRLGRATVYRTVEVLREVGLVDRVEFADGTHRYRLCGGSHHHHVTCTRCHRVMEVEACLPGEVFAAIALKTNFALEGHALDLFGCCADCRAKAEASEHKTETASN
jgi:Fur family transcriptional regulator, ferric uptake regulator